MSETSRFDQDYSDYMNSFNAYQQRALAVKELAAMQPEDALKEAATELGTQLGVHLFTKGFGAAIDKGKNYYQSLKSKANDAAQDLKTQAKSKVGQVSDQATDATDDIVSRVNGASRVLQSRVGNAVDEASDYNMPLSTQVIKNVQPDFDPENLPSFQGLGDLQAQASGRIDAAYNQHFDNPLYDENDAPSWGFSDPMDTDIFSAYGVPSAEPRVASNFVDDDPMVMSFPEFQASRFSSTIPRPQAGLTSNRIGDLLSQQRRQPIAEEEEEEPQFPDVPLSLSSETPDEEEANRVTAEEQSNVSTLESAGLTEEQAETAMTQGDVAVQGGRLLDPAEDVKAEEAADVGGDVAADVGLTAGDAVEEGVEVAATTGAESGGVGDIVGGLIAVGGLLGSLFGGHHSKPPPPPVELPALSIPVFQAGLGSN